MTRDLLLVGVGILFGLLLSTAITRPWRRPAVRAVLTDPIQPGPSGRVVPCPDCKAGIALWTGEPGARRAVKCGTCDGTGVVPARSRMWLHPDARVVDRAGALGTVLDPVTAYVPLGKLVGDPRPWGDGRWPVRFDVDPNTVRWCDAAELDPVTPADEELLSKIARAAPRLRSVPPDPSAPLMRWL